MEGSVFAAATFGDQDAGSGPVHCSPSLGPMTGAIHNISARNLSDIGALVPDDRQFLRSWRRQMNECLAQQNSRMIRFLIADISGDFTESDMVRRCNDVLQKYSKSTWNFSSSIRDLSTSFSLESTSEEIGRELGLEPSVLRDALKRTVRLYVNSATSLTTAETRLEEKLKRLEAITGRINDLMFLEPTSSLETLTEPTRVYLDSVLGKINIEDDYKEMVTQYKRFSVLRGLVSLMSFQRTPNPTCTICMTKEISFALTPCGHTFCEECCRSQITACYICRVQVRDKIRLFFS